MQLTRTNAVFSRIALVSSFCAEIQLSVKILEIWQKSYFARRLTEPEDETEKSHEGPTPGLGAAQARPRLGVVWPPPTSFRPLLLLYDAPWPKNRGRSTFFQREFRFAAATRNPNSEPETPFWHPAGTGIWRRSSPSPSPTPLHQPAMIPPSMCE